MKRTGEYVLGIIGIVVYAFITLLAAFMVWMQNNEDKVKDLMKEAADESSESVMSPEEIDEMIESMGSSGWPLLIAGILTVILGIVALVFLKGNKRPKLAGIILVALAVLSLFVFGGFALFGTVPYLIAGLMCLIRKPPKPLEE